MILLISSISCKAFIYNANEHACHSFILLSDSKCYNTLNTALYSKNSTNLQKYRAVFLAVPTGFIVTFLVNMHI